MFDSTRNHRTVSTGDRPRRAFVKAFLTCRRGAWGPVVWFRVGRVETGPLSTSPRPALKMRRLRHSGDPGNRRHPRQPRRAGLRRVRRREGWRPLPGMGQERDQGRNQGDGSSHVALLAPTGARQGNAFISAHCGEPFTKPSRFHPGTRSWPVCQVRKDSERRGYSDCFFRIRRISRRIVKIG
jgi:hypothetical protein